VTDTDINKLALGPQTICVKQDSLTEEMIFFWRFADRASQYIYLSN